MGTDCHVRARVSDFHTGREPALRFAGSIDGARCSYSQCRFGQVRSVHARMLWRHGVLPEVRAEKLVERTGAVAPAVRSQTRDTRIAMAGEIIRRTGKVGVVRYSRGIEFRASPLSAGDYRHPFDLRFGPP